MMKGEGCCVGTLTIGVVGGHVVVEDSNIPVMDVGIHDF